MPPVILDARRNPPTIYENVDVQLARQYRDQARQAMEEAGEGGGAAVEQARQYAEQIQGSAQLISTALQPGASAGALAEFDVDPALSLAAGNLGKLLMAT